MTVNTVEFAVEDGIPYAIDFMNPAPDAEATSAGQENFEWVVNAVAEMAVRKALSDENPARELRWQHFWRDLCRCLPPSRSRRLGSGCGLKFKGLKGSRASLGVQSGAAVPRQETAGLFRL